MSTEVLSDLFLGLNVFCLAALIVYHYQQGNWIARLAVSVFILTLAATLFATADIYEILAKRSHGENVIATVANNAKFVSSVIWAAIGVGLTIESVK